MASFKSITKQAAQNGLNFGNWQRNQSMEDTAKANKIADSFMSIPGKLSNYAQANYGQAIRNNASGANQLRQQGFRTLAQRGFGAAPLGMGSSVVAGANEAQNRADSDAFTNAQNQTAAGNQLALGHYDQQVSQMNPTSAYGQSTQSAQVGSQMGSTFGSIMKGIGAVTGLASNFLPGGQIYGAFGKMKNKSGAGE